MLDHQKTTGTDYTATVALLAAAVVFSPALLIVSRPVGFAPVALALAFSAACGVAAAAAWRKRSRLTIPSLETPAPRSK